MEETPFPRDAEQGCANCGQPVMDGDYPTPLCSDCRGQLTRLNVPVWIWLFAGGIAVILLFSLFTLPRSISLGVHQEKGIKAAKDRRFNTAEKELIKVLEKTRDNVDARGYLLISAFYNQDYLTFQDQIKKLQNVDVKNTELFEEIKTVMTRADGYVSNDTLEKFKAVWPDKDHIPDTAWMGYLRKNTDDRFAAVEYASLLFDRKQYHLCDSLTGNALQSDHDYFPALLLGASAKREVGDLDGAMAYTDRLLTINKESIYGISSRASTLLRQKKDAQALDLALKGYAMNNKNLHMMTTLVMAYHFSGRTGDRDALLKKAWPMTEDASDSATVQYVVDVINKKEKFRD